VPGVERKMNKVKKTLEMIERLQQEGFKLNAASKYMWRPAKIEIPADQKTVSLRRRAIEWVMNPSIEWDIVENQEVASWSDGEETFVWMDRDKGKLWRRKLPPLVGAIWTGNPTISAWLEVSDEGTSKITVWINKKLIQSFERDGRDLSQKNKDLREFLETVVND
jgi:hypothetical protein